MPDCTAAGLHEVELVLAGSACGEVVICSASLALDPGASALSNAGQIRAELEQTCALDVVIGGSDEVITATTIDLPFEVCVNGERILADFATEPVCPAGATFQVVEGFHYETEIVEPVPALVPMALLLLAVGIGLVGRFVRAGRIRTGEGQRSSR